MKDSTVDQLRVFKQQYVSALADKPQNQKQEACAIGMGTTAMHGYLDPNSASNLPAALIPNSFCREELLSYLAEESGGCFIRIHGGLNGTTLDENASILRAMSKLQTEKNPKKIEKLYREIEIAAARAAKEVQNG